MSSFSGQENVRWKWNGQRWWIFGRFDGYGIIIIIIIFNCIIACCRPTSWRFESRIGRWPRWRIEITSRVTFAHVGRCTRILFQFTGRCLRSTWNAFSVGHERRPVKLLERSTICRVSFFSSQTSRQNGDDDHFLLFLLLLSSSSLKLYFCVY